MPQFVFHSGLFCVDRAFAYQPSHRKGEHRKTIAVWFLGRRAYQSALDGSISSFAGGNCDGSAFFIPDTRLPYCRCLFPQVLESI